MQLKLINNKDANSFKAKRTSCNSQCLTDLDVSSPFNWNNKTYKQYTNKGDQLLK